MKGIYREFKKRDENAKSNPRGVSTGIAAICGTITAVVGDNMVMANVTQYDVEQKEEMTRPRLPSYISREDPEV